jgi:ABC-2 type transport system permease protein
MVASVLMALARSVLRSRRVLYLLVTRDLKVRYAGSLLGYVWTVLDPLLIAGVYWFIFTKVFSRASLAPGVPYIVFLLAALLPWNWSSGALTESTRALTREAKLVRSTNTPRETWVLRSVLSKGMEFLFSIPVLAGFMLVLHVKAPARVVFLPFAVLLLAVLLVGLSLLIAPLAVLFSDVERVIRIVLRLLFYASPVIYAVRHVPQEFAWVYYLNPFAGILDLIRFLVLPNQSVHGLLVLSSVVISVAILCLGSFVFSRLEPAVLKEL